MKRPLEQSSAAEVFNESLAIVKSKDETWGDSYVVSVTARYFNFRTLTFLHAPVRRHLLIPVGIIFALFGTFTVGSMFYMIEASFSAPGELLLSNAFEVVSNQEGILEDYMAKTGEFLEERRPIAKIGNKVIFSTQSGILVRKLLPPSAKVRIGDPLVVMNGHSERWHILSTIPIEQLPQINKGMTARFQLARHHFEHFGQLSGQVLDWHKSPLHPGKMIIELSFQPTAQMQRLLERQKANFHGIPLEVQYITGKVPASAIVIKSIVN